MSDGTMPVEPAEWKLSATQLTRLFDVVIGLGHEVGLTSVLRRVVECAADLLDARYGALGILDESGDGLADFLHVGIDDAQAEAIGALPQGIGLLGHLIRDPRPLRLTDLTAHEAAQGFPPNHPPMTTFLGVPVRVRGAVFGNLYLADKRDGRHFTAADEQLAVALAAVAGVAVENSQLHARVSTLAVVEERERIARDLYDTVIQRMFSIGLALQRVGGRVDDAELAGTLQQAAVDLDDTVQHIRTTVFDLGPGSANRRVRRELTEFIHEIGEQVGIETTIDFDGDLGGVIGSDGLEELTRRVFTAARDAIVGLREHGGAAHAHLSLAVGDGLTLRIATDGQVDASSDDWLGCLRRGADELRGRVVVTTDASGSEIVWTVPLRTGASGPSPLVVGATDRDA